MTTKEKIVHRQQFQNAQQTVEVIIKAKPKPKHGLREKPKPEERVFVRDCILKKEIENLNLKEIEKKTKAVTNTEKSEKPKAKCSYPTTHIQIHKKSRKKREKAHNVLPPNMTWREFLESRTLSNISECQTSHSHQESSLSSSYNPNKQSNHFEKWSANEPLLEASLVHPEIHISNANTPSANIGQQHRVDKMTQTVPKDTSETHKNFNKSYRSHPVSRFTKPSDNQAINSDQTQSPFGQSALKLLHELRERLRSQGDREGSNIVSAIEAYFGTVGSNSGAHDTPDGRISESPQFPSVFQTPHQADRVSYAQQQNKELQSVVAEQEKELRDQRETIRELKSLSERLVAYHEQLTRQLESEGKGKASPEGQGGTDSGIERSCRKEEMQRAIEHLTVERDALSTELRSQRDIILHLEIELSQSSKLLETERRANSAPSALSQPTRPIHPLKTRPIHPPKAAAKPASHRVNNDENMHLIRHTPDPSNESDSAYEERDSKSSKTTSKTCSSSVDAHPDWKRAKSADAETDRPQTKDWNNDRSCVRNDRSDRNNQHDRSDWNNQNYITDNNRNDKNNGTNDARMVEETSRGQMESNPRPVLSELGPYSTIKGKQNPQLRNHPTQPRNLATQDPNHLTQQRQPSHLATAPDHNNLTAYERVVRGGALPLMPPPDMCFSFMSDVSSEHLLLRSTPAATEEQSLLQVQISRRDGVPPSSSSKYFASTRRSDELQVLSPSKVSRGQRRRFDDHLSAIQSVSSSVAAESSA